MDKTQLTLICPDNDTEAHTIIGIAQRLGIDTRVSPQPHGARLEHEPARNLSELKHHVAIVEIPGPEVERKLIDEGHELHIIDHHDYLDQGLDRRQPLSSLEQFAELIGYELTRFEKAIGIADRGYIYGLVHHGYSREEIEQVIDYNRSLDKHDNDNYKENLVKEATKKSLKKGEVHIIMLPSDVPIGIALASQFIILNNLPEIQNILIIYRDKQGNATKLKFSGKANYIERLKTLGGWSGGEPEISMFWGTDRGELLPEVERLLSIGL